MSPEGRQIFANLTVRENLLLGGYQQTSKSKLHEDTENCLHPLPGPERTPRTKSRHPQRRRTANARHRPGPHGNAPNSSCSTSPRLAWPRWSCAKSSRSSSEINAAGTTVFLVEQNAHLALAIAHRGYVLQTGEVLLTDTAQNLLHHPDVKKAYLGG
jgi:branched-chain amino acid transport system ATP-binding protein